MAAATLQVPERQYGVESAFDTYTTADPYREYTAATRDELQLLERASRELADAVDQTADDFDAVDQHVAQMFGGGR